MGLIDFLSLVSSPQGTIVPAVGAVPTHSLQNQAAPWCALCCSTYWCRAAGP